METIIEKLRQDLKEAKKESADKKQASKLKQDLFKSSDYHKKKTFEEKKTIMIQHQELNTTSRVKYQENTKIKNFATDLDDFKRFVGN